MKRSRLLALVCAAAAAALVLAPTGVAVSEELQQVIIANFPKIFNVEGSVGVSGTISHARFVALREIVVPPVSPKETTRLVQGPSVESLGFTGMVLGLSGQTRGEVFRPGTVGVILLPDDDPIVKIFEEKGQMQFSEEVIASGVSAASPYFASSQNRVVVAFPRYRSYFYNTSDKTVTVNLYAYLTN